MKKMGLYETTELSEKYSVASKKINLESGTHEIRNLFIFRSAFKYIVVSGGCGFRVFE
jgi:hypothetical protein